MCGISAYFARESKPTKEVIDILLKYGETRGTDAIGVSIINNKGLNHSYKEIGISKREYVINMIDKMNLHDLVLINHRSAPETESESVDKFTIQPIIDEKNGLILTHNGSVSNFIYNELKNDFSPLSKIDSEAIIWAYLKHGRNMKETMEYLSGGFSFLMMDIFKGNLYAVCTHNPLYCGYVVGHGLFFSSIKQAIYDIISHYKGLTIDRMNLNVWEDFYAREIPSNTITEINLASGMINETKFIPRYIHPKYDPFKHKKSDKTKVLVSASGGLDSSTTLAILKESGYDVTAVHFKYGHRGQEAERIAVKKITDILDIPLVVFDIEENMKILDNDSMLTNPNHEITTGTNQGLKTTVAWTCFRNGLFVSYMGALAESMIINNNYDEVYLTGGFLNLSEEGGYPDNSKRFINAFSKFAKFASIVGTKIKPLYCCANLLKAEQYILLDKLNLLEKIGPWLISCDRPIVQNGIPKNCSDKDGNPMCGSGKLSKWANELSGTKDYRKYYIVNDPNYDPFINSNLKPKRITIEQILNKLILPEKNLEILKNKIT